MNPSSPIVGPGFRFGLSVYYYLLGILGAATGAAVGYFAFVWLLWQGLYALALPGFCIGLFTRLLLRRNLAYIPLLCAGFALLSGLYLEWRFFPFVKDRSLYYFISHLHQLRPFTWILLTIGAILAYHLSKSPGHTDEADPFFPKTQGQEDLPDSRNVIE